MIVVYSITGPTGKQYVGVSKNLKARWQKHVRRALTTDARHPFLDSIRKHGAAAFTVVSICDFDSIRDALAYEVFEILVRKTQDRRFGYNVSRGGEYDCLDGPRKFWAEIRLDPERYAAYLQSLRTAGRLRAEQGLIDAGPVVAYNRAKTARERWTLQHRATRVAAKHPHSNGGPKVPNGNGEAVRAAWEAQPPSFKKRHSIVSRKNALALWAGRTEQDRADVAAKISVSVKALQDCPEYRARNRAGLDKGRANMDREVQARAASKGLKKFWEDLRNNPPRYAEYMARRTKTLLKTIESK